MDSQPQELDLSWLYHQQQLKLREILPTTRPFSIIQISELVDPSDFIRPDSVVLSVGIAFADDPDRLRDWAHTLATAGVIAIGFGSGLTFPQIPKALIDASLHLGLGLFEVPREIPFLSITTAVRDEQIRRAGREQQELLLEQDRLNSIAISGGLEQLCKHTSDFLDAAIAILDSDGRVSCAISHGDLDAIPQARSRLNGANQAITTDNTFGLIHRMTLFGDRHHVLSVLMKTRPSEQHRALIRHCAGLADILLQRPHAMRTREVEVKSLAISLLLGRTSDLPTVRGVFADVSDSSGKIRPVLITGNREQAVKKALTSITTQLNKQDRALAHLALDDFTELIFLRGNRSVPNIVELFGTTTKDIRMCIGLPTPTENINQELIDHLSATAQVLPLGAHSEPRDASAQWLKTPAIRAALNQRARDTFNRVLAYDATSNTELARTLVCFVQHAGHIGDTATELGVHRHTIRTRIERIEEICELDINDPLTKAELLLVVATRRI
ncbi:regulatory protein [Corynebacterium deserti GIMN1.010]|uniref:Regulatory protein n=1 Tax=Corynebacterium deserti GIMN1.010 TaxID=931089 RepID=A0A0M4CW58_9CORY|nr:PucR family transcriptional regulator [Corynebacterium deserti]ALC04970.1 regulatory protein [Corynebacterium deserti GIMN1.010]